MFPFVSGTIKSERSGVMCCHADGFCREGTQRFKLPLINNIWKFLKTFLKIHKYLLHSTLGLNVKQTLGLTTMEQKAHIDELSEKKNR